MPIYRVQAPNGKIYKVEGPENADPNALFGFVQQQLEAERFEEMRRGEYGPGLLDTLTSGVSRGAKRLGSTFGDVLPAMVASGLGYDEYAKRQMEEAAQTEREIQATNRPLFTSYKQIQGPMQALKYGIETVGEQVPNIATSLVPGLGAAGIATRVGLGVAGRAAAVGAGTFLGSYAQNAPEVFQNIFEATGKLEPGAAAIAGAASAALDSILPASLARSLTGPAKIGLIEKVLEKSGMDRGLLRSVTASMLMGIPTEGLTEGAQEAISIAAEKFIAENPQVFGSKEWERIMESAVRGAVAGGAFAGAGGGVEAARAGAQRKQAYADALERRGQRQLAAEVRRSSETLEEILAQNPQMQLPGFELGAASTLLPPTPEAPAAPKELKGRQAELFTEEGALTPGVERQATRDEKASANRARQQAKREAAELKEAQAKLRRFLGAKQATLPGFDEASIQALQEQTAAQQQAAQATGQGDLFAPTTPVPQTPEEMFDGISDAVVAKAISDPRYTDETRQAAAQELQRRQAAAGAAVPTTELLREESRKELGDGYTNITYGFGDKGFASVIVTPDKSAYVSNIQLGDADSTQRGKGVGTSAYVELGQSLAKQGITLESTRWSKHQNAISPAALRVWEKLKEMGFAKQTGVETGKVFDRFNNTEEVREIPVYEFTPPTSALTPSQTEVISEPVVRGKPQVPTPETAPTVIDDLKAFGKIFGIGPTARILRSDSPLAGKDISNPADAAEVKRILEAYASGKPAAGAAEKIDAFLKRPEFQGVTDVAGTVEQPTGASVGVPSEPAAGPAPGTVEPVEPSGVVPPAAAIEQPVGGEVQQPSALAPEEVAAADIAAEEPAPAPELGKRAQKDIAKAEAGAAKSAEEQAKFIAEVDDNINAILVSRMRELGRNMGVPDKELPALNYRGTEYHSVLRIAPLLTEYRDVQETLRKYEEGTPQEAKNRQQLAQLEQTIADSSPDALQFFQQLRSLDIPAQERLLSLMNREALKSFDADATSAIEKIKGDIAAKRAEEAKQAAADAAKRAAETPTAAPATPTPTAEERALEAEIDAATEAINEALFEQTGITLYETPEQTRAKEENQRKVNERVNREVARLPEKQKQALEAEYQAPRDSDQFLRRLKEDVITLVLQGANAVAKGIRAAVKKVAEGVLAVALVFNPNVTLPNFSFDLPKAYSQTVTQVVEIKEAVPAAARAKMSPLAQLVYENMAATAKKSGKGFIIADKPAGMIHFFKPDGSVLVQDAALYGKDWGDVMAKLSSLKGGPKITPAGQYTLEVNENPEYAGGKTLRLVESQDETGFIAVHAAYLGDAKEKRAEKLAKLRAGEAAESKISYGCINTAHDTFLNAVLPNIDTFNGGMMFVLPDAQEKTASMFPAEKRTETKTFTGFEKNAKAPTSPRDLTAREEKALPERMAQRDQVGRLFLPAYQGPTFNATDAQLAQSGDLKGLLRSMLGQIKDPAIAKVLRKIQSLNLNTKVVVDAVEDGKAGSYDPATNTITLDPQNGLNAHTFIHELVHAAISNVLANPNHPLTKDFSKFFVQIQDRLSAAYGAQDLQEFAAELVGNPSFQAVLKDIKTPRSESMFRRVLRSIAEFFGFPPKTSAFNTGLDFIEKALDITNGIDATPAQKMFLTMGNFPAIGDIGRAMPAMTREAAENARNVFSNLNEGGGFKAAAFGVLRLDNLRDMYGRKLPSIQMLLDALEKRTGMQERRIKDANQKYLSFVRVQRKHPDAMKRLNDIAIDARLAEVDILNPRFTPTAQNAAEYSRLSQAFRSLPDDVQNVYRTIRKDYDDSFTQYRKLLTDAAERASPSLAAKLAERFQTEKPVPGYIPFLRQGNFWVEYTDPATGEPVVSSFESIRERQQFIDQMLGGRPHRTYQNIQDAQFSGDQLPPTHFIMQVMNQLRGQGASQAQLDGVYQAYLASFPAESLMKQFMKSKNRLGMERDIVRGYGDLMVRYARKLANSEYIPEIDRAVRGVQNEAQASGDPTLTAVAQNITDQSAFFHNPNFSTFIHTATALSYFEYIAGNISSALINITSLPLLVYPMLTGRFGWGNTYNAMRDAGRTAMNDWGSTPKYKKLYETLMDHAQLEHTMAREVMEGRRQTTNEFVGLKARILDGLSIPFVATEKYNRAVTAISAYDLAKQSGMPEDQAIRYALNTVKDVHTSGMAATGPKWMQTPMGRLFFTFKSFVWNSAYIMARAFHQAFKGEDPAIRKAAQRQLLATYGMATVFVGMKGMPFYGAISVMANMLNALFGDEDEPFDFDEFMRDIFGEFLFKGAFNYATNIEIANRAGIATDLIFRDDPRGVAEHGYVLSAMQQAFGPIGSIAVNSGRAVELFQQGEIERGIETIAPSFVRNAMKGTRYLLEGATTIKGDPVMEDISAYNSLMQMIGFSPADLSSQYERVQAAKGFEREVNKRRTQLMHKYDMARTAGDYEMMSEALEEIQRFNEARPAKRITKDSLDRSRRAREAAEKDMIAGVRFDKKLRPEIEERFFDPYEED